MKLQVNIDPEKIEAARGLGSSTKFQEFLAEEVARLSDPYVPFSGGSGVHLKSAYNIASDGSYIHYTAPYAHYQYYGEVMACRAPKHYTGVPIQYNDGTMRGKEWEKRMLADRGDDLAAAAAKQLGGEAK